MTILCRRWRCANIGPCWKPSASSPLLSGLPILPIQALGVPAAGVCIGLPLAAESTDLPGHASAEWASNERIRAPQAPPPPLRTDWGRVNSWKANLAVFLPRAIPSLSGVAPDRQSLSSRRLACGVHSELQLSELPQLGPVDGSSVKRLTWPVCYSSAVRIAIRVPAMNERGPQYMEQAIAAIHQANPRRLPIHLEFGHHHETVALT